MDEIVQKALKKWPNVPHAFGWISLNQAGKWRFHPGGDFQANPAGESIDNQQIAAFLGRNYMASDDGCWFIQNGPQRVYVTLPFAPLIMRLDDTAAHFVTHNGLQIKRISRWLIDENGHIYAESDAGPCMLDSHDMQHFIDHCRVHAGTDSKQPTPLDEEILGSIMSGDNDASYTLNWGESSDYSSPLEHAGSDDIPTQLGFVRFPTASEKSD